VSNRAFRSHARNGEDIVLWRALADVADGRFVDVGARGHAMTGSITAALAEQGWKGVEVPASAVLERPLDDVLDGHGLHGGRIDVLVLDAAGREAAVLATLDLHSTRPVVLLVRAAPPRASGVRVPEWEAEVLDADYRFRLFTGLYRIYVAAEHDDSVGDAVSYPACVLDEDATVTGRPSAARNDRDADDDAVRWRALALNRWDEAANGSTPTSAAWEVAMLRDELAAMRATVSWRLTRPVRVVRRRLSGPALRRAAAALRGGR
jgi:hypothetical protein